MREFLQPFQADPSRDVVEGDTAQEARRMTDQYMNNNYFEMANNVKASGQTLTPTWAQDPMQTAKASFMAGAKSNVMIDSGTANIKELVHVTGVGASSMVLPETAQLMDGALLLFKNVIASTGPVTINVYRAAGIKVINAATINGQFLANSYYFAQYDYTSNSFTRVDLGRERTGDFIDVRIFSESGIYLPTAGTKSIIVEVQGAGGSGGGCPATGAGQAAVGSGGSAGSFASSKISSGFSSVAMTVGAGGAAAVGFASNNGGATSFGSFVTCPGGPGGTVAGPAVPPLMTGVNSAALPVGANLLGSVGSAGGVSISTSAVTGFGCFGGIGGVSSFGGGGASGASNSAGVASPTQGAGGGGCALTQNQPAIAGGRGGNGLIIVYEFGVKL